MSNFVSAKVHKKVFGSATRKAVMIYFADKASDGGEGIWASKTTIAAELELARSTVIKTINELVADGILIVVGDRRHRNGATVEYDISMVVVDRLPDVELPRSEPTPGRGDCGPTRPGAGPVRQADPSESRTLPVREPDIMMSESRTQTILEPSLNHTGAGAREAMPAPETLVAFERFWQAHPKPKQRERTLALWLAAKKSGVATQRIIAEAQRYRQVNQGKDSRYLVSSDRWLEQRRWEGEPGKPPPSQDERARGIAATARHIVGRIRDGAFVAASAWTPPIVACVVAEQLLTTDQLRAAGVRV